MQKSPQDCVPVEDKWWCEGQPDGISGICLLQYERIAVIPHLSQ
jgi:hypothetical protein